MIIKVKTHKHRPGIFKQLIEYIFEDKGKALEKDTFAFFNTLSSNTPEGIIQEFTVNDGFRKKASNGVCLHHFILSFSPEDSDKISQEILNDLIYKFIELRGNSGLVFGRLHESDHKHVHLLFSANQYRSDKSIRMDKYEFQRIHKELEAYQLEKYPELSNSLVKIGDIDFHSKAKGLTEVEKHMESRGKTLRKLSFKDQITGLMDESSHTLDFYKNLRENGFKLYSRSDKISGIITPNGRKYRFTTLGIGLDTIAELDHIYMNHFDLGDEFFDLQ